MICGEQELVGSRAMASSGSRRSGRHRRSVQTSAACRGEHGGDTFAERCPFAKRLKENLHINYLRTRREKKQPRNRDERVEKRAKELRKDREKIPKIRSGFGFTKLIAEQTWNPETYTITKLTKIRSQERQAEKVETNASRISTS